MLIHLSNSMRKRLAIWLDMWLKMTLSFLYLVSIWLDNDIAIT